MHQSLTETGHCAKWSALVFALILVGCGGGSADTTLAQTTAPPPVEATTTTSTAAPPAATTSSSTTTTSASIAESRAVDVPVAPTAPTIDGVLGPGEWDAATTDTMSDGTTVHLTQFEGMLYVAVAGDEIGSVNVVLGIDDAVWFLHSSAALGSALYREMSGSWQLEHGFRWCCRNASDTAGRSDLFAAEDWQANIGYTGDPGIVEYQIALPWEGAAVAISSIRDEDDTGFWPRDLPPETRTQLWGVPPQERIFNLEEWPRIGG